MEQFTQSASQLYQVAANVAQRAGEAANTAREKLAEWKKQHYRYEEWQKRMSNTHPEIWCLIFVIVCVCEYMFSRELYRDFLPDAPYVPAFGLIVLSVLISHYISTMLSSHLREVEEFELSQIEEKKHLPQFELKAMLKKEVTRNFIIGMVLFLFVGGLVFYLSFDRAGRELAAGRRTKPFGMQDLLPVVFYVFEVLSGIFVVYLCKKYTLKLTVNSLYKAKETNIDLCNNYTREAITKFQNAEEKGYNPAKDTVSEDLHKAYYRSKRKDRSEEEDYIKDPALHKQTISFKLQKGDGSGLQANVRIVTEFNFTSAGASNPNGEISFTPETYEGDAVKEIIVEYYEGSNQLTKEKNGPWELNQSNAHTIII